MISSEVGVAGQSILFKFDKVSHELVRFAKDLTGMHGHNQQGAVLPQDELIECHGWIHGYCGFAITFKWASGRQDWHNILDVEGVVDSSLGDLRKIVWDALPSKHELPFYLQPKREVQYEYR